MAPRENLILPEILSIEDFFQKYCPYQKADPLELNLMLYHIYKKHEPKENSFSNFFKWGKILLNDFGEIDENLVDAKGLFQSLSDIKFLEDKFHFSLQSMEGEESMPDTFTKLWQVLDKVYQDFNHALKKENIAYQGQIYRYVAEHQAEIFNSSPNHFIFAGFNRFNRSELSVVEFLLKTKKADVYLDGDDYYLDNPTHEAGFYLKQQIHHLFKGEKSGIHWIGKKLKNKKLDLHLHPVNQMVGQAKIAGDLLRNAHREKALKTDETAIILSDPAFLFPMLHALDESLGQYNVTTGYPLKQTSLYLLFEAVAELHRNMVYGKSHFNTQNVMKIFRHELVQKCDAAHESLSAMATLANSQKPYVYHKQLAAIQNPIIQLLAKIPTNTQELLALLQAILNTITLHLNEASEAANNEPETDRLTREYLFGFEKQFNRLQDLQEIYQLDENLLESWHIIRQLISGQEIAFTGEPLVRLQLMGILESRNLDFKNLFILGANEGKLPPSPDFNTYIPNSLRLHFQMPGIAEKTRIYAYYFYRLLHESEQVHLFYDADGSSAGSEASHYIAQLKYELQQDNPNIKIHNHQYQNQAEVSNPSALEIPYDEKVVELLQAYFTGDKVLSASALSTYFENPLAFYLKYLLEAEAPYNVAEKDSPTQDLGIVFHTCMEAIFEEYPKGYFLDAAELKRIEHKDYITKAVESGIRHHHQITDGALIGKSLVLKSILEGVVQRTLRTVRNKHSEGYQLIDTEMNLGGKYQSQPLLLPLPDFSDSAGAYLFGKLDLVIANKAGSHYSIIDYKTGSGGQRLMSKLDPTQVIEGHKRKEFQLMFYALLMQKKFPHLQYIDAGILYAGKFKYEQYDFTTAFIHEFENSLQKHLQATLFQKNGCFSEVLT